MNWDFLRSLTESRPRIAAVLGLISLAGATVGAIANGVDVLGIVGGQKPSEAQMAEAQAREATAIQAVADAASQRAAAEAESQAWATALQTNSTAAYDFYLATYPSGAFAEQARAAKSRLQATAARTGAFSLSQLHPTVAAAVEAARQAAQDASARQTQAERAANMAAAAAAQAKGGARGFDTLRFRDKDSYEGEVAGGKPEGLGVYIQGDAPYTGDRYQGQLAKGVWSGVGVYESANPGPQRPTRYGGEFAGGRLSGSGVIMRPDGGRQSGAVVDGALNGHGVDARADGSRFEGEFRKGAPNGMGVLWSTDGAVLEAGRYEDGVLVQPLRL
jgi:hypothetical protein